MKRARFWHSGRAVVLLAVLIYTGLLTIAPQRVHACSCAAGSPFERLDQADAAFVGRLIERPDDGAGGEGDFVFSVERAVKGDLPSEIRVHSALDGAACGFELTIGQRTGVFLYRDGDHWSGGLCGQIDPDELLTVADPQPQPDRAGPISALVGMSAQGTRTVALDAAGRTVAYGAGEGQVFAYAICPEAKTVVEYVLVRDPDTDRFLHLLGVRDLLGFHVVREIYDDRVPNDVDALECLDPAGDEVLLFSAGRSEGSPPHGRIIRVSGTEFDTVAEFAEQSGCFGGAAFDMPNSLAYFSAGARCRGIYRYDLRTDQLDEIARISADAGIDAITGMSLSPDGRHIAFEAHPGPEPLTFRVLMFDLSSTPVEYVEAAFGGPFEPHTLLWISSDQFLLTGTEDSLNTASIFTPELEASGTIRGIWGGLAGVHGEDLYLLEPDGRLVSVPASGGQARQVRQLSDPTIVAFITVGGQIEYDPAATRPDNLAAVVFPTPVEISAPVVVGELPGASFWERALGIGVMAMVISTGFAVLARSTRRRLRSRHTG